MRGHHYKRTLFFLKWEVYDMFAGEESIFVLDTFFCDVDIEGNKEFEGGSGERFFSDLFEILVIEFEGGILFDD